MEPTSGKEEINLISMNRRKKQGGALYYTLFLLLHTFCVFAEDPEMLKPYLRKSTTWECLTLKKEVPVNIYYITRSTHSRPWNIGSPVMVYIKNHGEDRIGTEQDASILMDYIKEHYIVITVDFNNNPEAVSPNFDKDLHALFKSIYADEEGSLFDGINMTPRQYRCFFVPAGCRVATDLVFWELDKHGANGMLEFIMDRYNKKIAGIVYGKEKVTSPEEMTDRQNRPFQYQLAMDIVYPSMTDKKVPIVINAGTQVTRHPNVAPQTYRPHMMGFLMRGYAYAILDHCYDPLRRHFWYNTSYSLNPWNGLAANTAAIRFIRANAQKFNIDARYIGAMGHSKGEYTVARLSDPDHINQEEQSYFKGFAKGSPEPQPNQEYSSHITVGYQSPGNWPQYVSENDVPTIVAHGDKDSFGGKYKEVFKKLKELDVNHVSMLMKGFGHEFPYGYDEERGFDRYRLVHDFFDSYLKVEEKIPPVILMVSPVHQSAYGKLSEAVSIHFAPEMDEKSVLEGVEIFRTADNKAVKGTWKSSRHNTRFTFTPKKPIEVEENYSVVISEKVKNRAGTQLTEEIKYNLKIQ